VGGILVDRGTPLQAEHRAPRREGARVGLVLCVVYLSYHTTHTTQAEHRAEGGLERFIFVRGTPLRAERRTPRREGGSFFFFSV